MRMSVALRYRRNPWIDGVSAVGALTLSALILLMLISGLGANVWRPADSVETLITLVPLPEPEPVQPPPPEPEPMKLLKRPSRTPGAPAPLQASPIEQPDMTIAPIAPPAPPSASTDGLGGPGIGADTGTGTGGSGNGGDGSVAGKLRLVPASWARRPSARELRSYYPDLARTARIDGSVLLACRVLPDKRAEGCRVLREQPKAFGFGAAALTASVTFRLNPPRRNEDPDTETRVIIPVNFGH